MLCALFAETAGTAPVRKQKTTQREGSVGGPDECGALHSFNGGLRLLWFSGLEFSCSLHKDKESDFSRFPLLAALFKIVRKGPICL